MIVMGKKMLWNGFAAISVVYGIIHLALKGNDLTISHQKISINRGFVVFRNKYKHYNSSFL